jgi:hypothetical protein
LDRVAATARFCLIFWIRPDFFNLVGLFAARDFTIALLEMLREMAPRPSTERGFAEHLRLQYGLSRAAGFTSRPLSFAALAFLRPSLMHRILEKKPFVTFAISRSSKRATS